ncbi:MAG: YlxR family protein [bacterium]|nr:YlxR family protein [bacterium]
MAKEKLRKCAGCNELKNRENLLKITKEHESGKLYINPNSKIFGRSAYLCYNKTCIIESLKKNRLARLLKTSISEEFKQELQSFEKD